MNRKALVTGGMGGLGEAICLKLAAIDPELLGSEILPLIPMNGLGKPEDVAGRKTWQVSSPSLLPTRRRS